MGVSYTLEEQETIIRFDRTPADAMLYTASPVEAERWRKLGIDVKPQGAHGWQATIPKKAVRIRKLVQGALPKRTANAGFLAHARRHKAPTQE